MAAPKNDNAESVVAQSVEAVQAVVDKADEKGFYGKAVDETPRENYTVQGVIAGKPTPEVPGAKKA